MISQAQESAALKVGMGRQVITPEQPMWMAGYASRTAPSDGKLHDLWAKAFAIEDASGARFVIVTTDLIGVSRTLTGGTFALVSERFNIPRENFLMTASHTHSGPVIRDNLYDMYGLDEEQAERCRAYNEALPGKIFAAVEQAIATLEPGTLSWGVGEAGFAKNRRKYTTGGVTNDFNPIGPVDHDVPVLVARNASGEVKGILVGYACHNTVLSTQQFCGDYAGYAQAYIEENAPGAIAMFAAGCGGDQNPLPRRTIELAEQYGAELGEAALSVLNESEMAEVRGPVRCAYEEIPLALTKAPDREEIEADLTSTNVYVQRLAKSLLKTLDEKGAIDETYPFPVQVWQFGEDDLQISALGGEATVDYSLRLKYELGRDKQFVIAYANDVCAYIPSLRVLREGGYEGEGAMVYYGFHGPWAPQVEEDIVTAVHELTKQTDLDASVAPAQAK